MSRFAEALKAGKFVVTTELNPPKGTDLGPLLQKAEGLKDMVDAFNLTDSHSARMSMSPMAVAHLLLDRNLEPILQMTCRDRNRLALQADLLGAYALGIRNISIMTGDPPRAGDHPDARPVFDLDSIALLRAVASLQSGKDLAGNALKGSPQFFVGAVVNPGVRDLDGEMRRMEEKIEAGARFFQTQAVYEPARFEQFMSIVQRYRVPVVGSFIMFRSGEMARRFNQWLPGLHIPEALIREMDEAQDKRQKGVEIAARIIREIRPMCQGVHITAVGWESLVPQVLAAAGIADSQRQAAQARRGE